MPFDLKSSKPVKEDVAGKPTATPGFDITSSRSIDTPFYEGFSVKEDIAMPFVKGARDIAASSPQKFANLVIEYGERAEEMPDYFDNAVSFAVPFHSIYKGVQAIKSKMKPAEGKAYAEAGKELRRRNQAWIDAHIVDYGEKEEGLAGFMYDLGGGATTLGAAIGVSAITKSPTAAAALFGIYQKGDIYEQGRMAGLTPRGAGRAGTVAGGVEGMLEYIGLDWMLNRAKSYAAKWAIRMGTEALQEWSQTVGENLVVRMGGIDETRKVFEGAGRSALVGAVLGGGANVVLSTFEQKGVTEKLEEAGVKEAEIKKVAKEIYEGVEKEAYGLVEKEAQLALPEPEKVAPEPARKEKRAIPEKPAIEQTLDTIRETYTRPETIARKEVKAIQSELISQMEASQLEAKDKAKFIKTIKNVQTQAQLERIAKEFKSRMERAKEQTEKAKISLSIKKELTKTKPVKKGQRRVAKYDYESSKFFEKARAYSKMTQEVAQAQLDKMPEEGLSEMDLIKRRILSLKASGAAASLEIHKRVFADIKTLKMLGAAAKEDADFEKLINRRENVDEALIGIEKVKGGQNIITAIKKGYAKAFGNIDSLFNFMFGANFTEKYSPEAQEKERDTAVYYKTKEITQRAAEIYDKDILYVFQDMANEQFELTDIEGLTHEVDRMQLIDIYNSLKNDAIKKRYYDAFGEDQILAFMNKLTENDMRLGDLLQEAVQEYRQILNERHIEITGRDLGFVMNYWPATSEHQPSVYDDYRMQGETPTAMKERAKGKIIPRPVNAWSKFQKHIGEAEHVKHLAREHEQLMRILTDRKVKHEITKKFGEDTYRTTMALMDGISLHAQTAKIDAISDLYGKALNNWIKAKLPSLSIFLRQLMSASNYMEHMPVTTWSAGFTKAIATPKQTFDYMWKNSPYLEARFHRGYKEALSRALDDAAKMSKAQDNWARGLSALVRVGDISAIIYGGKPYVDYLISEGMSEKEAFKKFEKVTLRAQQSGLTSSLSQFQQNKTVFARMLMAFKNTPAQYLRKMADATIAYHNKDISVAQYAKTMTIYGVIQPTLYVMAGWAYREGFRALGRIFRGERAPETDPLWKEILKQMIINPVTAIPFMKGAVDYAVRKMMGMKAYNITSLPMISDVETMLRKMTKKKKTFDDWVTIAGTPLEIGTGAPVLAIKRMFRYLMPEKKKRKKF